MGSVSVPVDTLFGIAGFLLQFGIVLATMMIWGGRMDQRIKQVEAHSETVQRVGPLEARFEQFERAMESRLENIERATREVGAAMQQLALALAKRVA
jgi:hypothetical protein